MPPATVGSSSRPRHERVTRVLGQIGFGVIPPGAPGGGWGAAEAASDLPEPRKARPATPRKRYRRPASPARGQPRAGSAGSNRFAAALVNRSRLQRPANAQALVSARGTPGRTAGLLDGRNDDGGPQRAAPRCRASRGSVRGSLARPRSGRKRRLGGALLAVLRRKPTVRAARDPVLTKEPSSGASR